MNTIEMETDVLVVGGGTTGPMAAVKAKEKNPKLRVMLLEKANVKAQRRDLHGTKEMV